MNKLLLSLTFCLLAGPVFAASLVVDNAEIKLQTNSQAGAVFQLEDTLFFITQGAEEINETEAENVQELALEGAHGVAITLPTAAPLAARMQNNQMVVGPKQRGGPQPQQASFIVMKDQLIVPFGQESSSKPVAFTWQGQKLFVFPTPLLKRNTQAQILGPYVALPTLAGVVTKAKNAATKVVVSPIGLAWEEEGYLQNLFAEVERKDPQPQKTAEYSATLERLLQAIADVERIGLPSEMKEKAGKGLDEEFQLSESDLAKLVKRRQSKNKILPKVISVLPRNLGDEGSYLAQQTSLFEALVGARSLEQRDQARYKLAQLSLFYHRPEEALSWLESMEPIADGQSYPAFAPGRFLYGVILTKTGRGGEAIPLFKDDIEEFADQKNIWLAYAYSQIGDHAQANALFENNIKMAEIYPPWVEVELKTAYVRSLEKEDKFTKAKKVLTDLKKQKTLTDEGKMILARIALVRQNEGEAERLYADVSSSDNLHWAYQAQHKFVQLLYDRGELGKEQVIEYYEQLASLWRSSDLEAELLMELARMYRETNDFKKALARYKTFSVYYRHLPEAKKIPEYMAETFTEVFLPENEGRYDDLALLSLYYDFRELTPSGTKGDQLLGFVGEKLRKLGLLERTIDLYENQLEYRVKDKLRKAEIGYILSRLYRLNLEEDKAISVLQKTFYAAMPNVLKQKRAVRLAEAYTQKQDFTKALKALEGITTPTAEKVRLNIAWAKADYATLITMLEGKFRENNVSWNPERQENFMRLAYSYYHTKRADKLKTLNALFAKNLAGSHMQITLNFMLGDLGMKVAQNVESDQPIAKVVEYLDQYNQFLENYALRREERFQERYRRSLFNRRMRQPSAPRVEN